MQSTLIARAADGLFLAASMDDTDSLAEYKKQAKGIIKNLTGESRCSVDSHPYVFHYLVEFGVVYLCLASKSYPAKLAFNYLEELQVEFHGMHGNDMAAAARPYAFVKFDSVIQKVKRRYENPRANDNLDKLNRDLGQVTNIMHKNIQDVLGRGEQLDGMLRVADDLKSKSRGYLDDTKRLNWMALYQKYGPPVIVVSLVSLVFYLRYWWW